ncbi:hypothetical protein BJ878DRAFT_526233 [Calycina marina]|uniref:Uncharacterized protein n=1 Tax=Calycina marina TaxID=1763456 RepID=A0A9P7YVF8_9HELO|nr:hypothetical protein BJ878DRAFT_526233 [Calycina marina]
MHQCGSTATEAFTTGCKFDLLSFAWLPSACTDEILTDEFLAREDWGWYRAPFPAGDKDRVSLEMVRQGTAGDLFVSKKYATTRCEFMWRKLQRFVDGTGAEAADVDVAGQQLLQNCSEFLDPAHARVNSSLSLLIVSYPPCNYRRTI